MIHLRNLYLVGTLDQILMFEHKYNIKPDVLCFENGIVNKDDFVMDYVLSEHNFIPSIVAIIRIKETEKRFTLMKKFYSNLCQIDYTTNVCTDYVMLNKVHIDDINYDNSNNTNINDTMNTDINDDANNNTDNKNNKPKPKSLKKQLIAISDESDDIKSDDINPDDSKLEKKKTTVRVKKEKKITESELAKKDEAKENRKKTKELNNSIKDLSSLTECVKKITENLNHLE
jgi:hypothetical protein